MFFGVRLGLVSFNGSFLGEEVRIFELIVCGLGFLFSVLLVILVFVDDGEN